MRETIEKLFELAEISSLLRGAGRAAATAEPPRTARRVRRERGRGAANMPRRYKRAHHASFSCPCA